MKSFIFKSLRLLVLCVVSIVGCSESTESGGDTAMKSELSVSTSEFGKSPSDETVNSFTLTNANGYSAVILEFGALLHSVEAPDKDGNVVDIILGCADIEGYNTDSPHFGTTTGRYANRIAKGKFTLDGTEYSLAINNDPNHLHGGDIGYGKVLWKGETYEKDGEVGVKLTYLSKDMEEGYPGNLSNSVTYSLNNDNELTVYFESTTDKPTVVNLTNHAYYNLSGHASGSILDHKLTIHAKKYTPFDDTFISTGAIDPVADTPLDFTSSKSISMDIGKIPGDPGGYDHNYVLDHGGKELAIAASVFDPLSGRTLEIWNDEPGLQFYTGNFLEGAFTGKGGAVYQKNNGFCLESQKHPDTPNHPNFPSAVLRPGETYKHTIVMKFGNK